jgi:glycosyltransferase involved in cell wall biosynthesis
MRVLTCIGDATSIDTHGGLPFHLLEAGQHAGFIDAGWKLSPEKLRTRRLIWNLKRLATRGETGGYQYSMDFLRSLTKQAAGPAMDADEIISIFPLFPTEHSKYTGVSLYIDATLKNNFEDYKLGEKLGNSLVSEALERERSLYQSAARVMCRSRMAAKSVVEDYGIHPSKVHFVPAGANISRNAAALQRPHQSGALKPVQLGFLGKDWRRKNLPFVLEVADVLKARGIDVEVAAAGFDPAKGPTHPLLRPIGFIAKRNDLRKFVAFIGSCHFMCLFSFAEAFGISNREALHLGVPVLARDVGGIRDTLPDDCGHLFASDARAEDVADIVESYARDADRYAALRAHVATRKHEFTWDAAVQKMIAIWNGSDAHSYSRYASKIS